MIKLAFDPRMLHSNDELFAYLVYLGAQLKLQGEDDLARLVEYAARFNAGSQTEFLHESFVALKSVERQTKSLAASELDNLSAVILQIESAFRAIGGA